MCLTLFLVPWVRAQWPGSFLIYLTSVICGAGGALVCPRQPLLTSFIVVLAVIVPINNSPVVVLAVWCKIVTRLCLLPLQSDEKPTTNQKMHGMACVCVCLCLYGVVVWLVWLVGLVGLVWLVWLVPKHDFESRAKSGDL